MKFFKNPPRPLQILKAAATITQTAAAGIMVYDRLKDAHNNRRSNQFLSHSEDKNVDTPRSRN